MDLRVLVLYISCPAYASFNPDIIYISSPAYESFNPGIIYIYPVLLMRPLILVLDIYHVLLAFSSK